MNEEYILINNHFKCCGDGSIDLNDDYDEETRRLEATDLLKLYIDNNLSNKTLVVRQCLIQVYGVILGTPTILVML